VTENVSLIVGLGFLDGALGAIVLLLNVQGGRGRSEEKGDWERVGADLDGGWGGRAGRWDVTELDVVSGLDGSLDDLAGTAVTAGETAKTAGTAGRATAVAATSGATITAGTAGRATTVGRDGGDESEGDNELLKRKMEEIGK